MRMLVAAALCMSLQGCWFVYIPGSLIGAVTDSLTGAEGAHCVGPATKVGDRVRLPGGGHGTVVSLSGNSIRCNDVHPVRALLQLDP